MTYTHTKLTIVFAFIAVFSLCVLSLAPLTYARENESERGGNHSSMEDDSDDDGEDMEDDSSDDDGVEDDSDDSTEDESDDDSSSRGAGALFGGIGLNLGGKSTAELENLISLLQQLLAILVSQRGGSTGGAPVVPTSTSTQSYTSEQVATHNTETDCWVIVNDKVYSVAAYIPHHPGGKSRIISQCGTDATAEFTTSMGGHQHSSNAASLLQNYFVGNLK